MPLIPLLYDGFGYFLDIVAGHKDIPGLDLVDLRRLQVEVDELACMMCRFYDHEDERRDAARRILNKIFGARRGVVIPLIEAASIGSVRSDGHVMWRNGVAMLVTDFKNRATGSCAMLKVELVRHVARLHKQKMQEGKKLFRGWRVPCLGLIIIGSDVKFYAVILVDMQYRLVSLTPALSFIPCASDGRDRRLLYSAFTAASVLQAGTSFGCSSQPEKHNEGTH
ncbi:hypothetical protein BGW80DRAFT_224693 [Lactifluus volemus]|nr:hypothetical protein BGW80DRAFT_224693 [Lactifluus volemus]